MKKPDCLLIALMSIVLGMTSCSSPETDLKTKWENPPLEFRMNRNWHNIPLDPLAMDSLILETLENGWGGLAINVPFSSYLSDEGMKATQLFCEKAKAKNLDLWLYDELGYPSGNAGDLVIKKNPEWESMGIFMKDTLLSTTGSGKVHLRIPPGEVSQMLAFPVKDGETDFSSPVDLSAQIKGDRLLWKAPPGSWRLFAATKHMLHKGFQAEVKSGYKQGAPYPSLMIPEVTEAFLESTHEKYVEYQGEDLGKYYTATFTDEPSSMALQFHHYKQNHALVPWHHVVTEEINKRYGYKPEDKLVELYFDEGPAGQEIRYQYFHTIADLMATNYFGTIKTWCEKHNFLSGGHLLLEESMIAHVPLYGDVMKCFREMHAPGIDILSCFPEEMPVHSPKLASSAAELMGYPYVMAEPCPVADRARLDGKETPAESVRGHLNMLLQGGITDFNCYLRLSNSDREEKNAFNTYVGRINMLLQGGYSASELAVVYPIESMWTRFMPRYHRVYGWKGVNGASETLNRIDSCFIDASRTMFDHRWEYLHLDSKAMAEAKALNGILESGPFRFKVVVLPSVNTLPEDAWSRLIEFAEGGGKLVFLEETPLNSHAHFPDTRVQEAFSKLLADDSNVEFLEEWTPEKLDELLAGWLHRPVRLGDESLDIGIAQKVVDGKDVFFVLNDSKREISTSLDFHCEGKLEEWDPATGIIKPFENGARMNLKPYHGKVYRSL